jgi:arylsulfatase A-like enzyme
MFRRSINSNTKAWAAIILGIAILIPSTATAADADRPNFVFFLVDDLGCRDIGAFNPDTFYETPNVDRLAAEGMRFTDGYAANPVCSPTRYSIMTGRHPSRPDSTNFFSGRRGGTFNCAPLHDRMDLEELTIAEALKEHGYKTAFLGKWHLGPTEEFWPENQGFDINKGGHERGGPYGPGRYFTPYGNPRLEDGPEGEHLPARLANESCQILEEFQDDPFMLYLAFYSVHTPLMAPEALVEKYRAKAAALPDADAPEFAPEEQIFPNGPGREVRIRQQHAVYAAMVESMDTAVGQVLEKLEELGLAENTVVMFMSDNGGLSTSEGSPTSNLPYRGGKGWLYEGGIREPVIIRWPGVTEPDSVCATPVVSMDFYPTMLDIADLPLLPERHQDGMSLVPLLRGADQLDRAALYWHYPHYSNQGGIPGGAIRIGDYKLIERFEDGRLHLYNLSDDPGERNDIAEQNSDRVQRMQSLLHNWYKEVDAKFLEPKDGGPMPWRPE